MAINPFMRAALKALSYPEILDKKNGYRLQRAAVNASHPHVLRPFYKIWDHHILASDHEVPVRVFSPEVEGVFPMLLFFHGGGWVTGDIESYTPACATMADLTGCRVASVDYRLAPEHPFPAGLEDCYGAARGLLENPSRAGLTDAEKIVLVGDSAGGNLAAAVSLLLREQGHRVPRRQILLYPVTHWDHDPTTSPFESVRRHGEDYRLTNTEVEDYFDMYVPDPVQRRNRLVSPLMAGDLSAQPDTLLITAELDLLCDEGEAYAHALAEAGNRVSVHRIEHAVHGFITLPRFARPLKEAYELIDAFLDEGPSGHAAS